MIRLFVSICDIKCTLGWLDGWLVVLWSTKLWILILILILTLASWIVLEVRACVRTFHLFCFVFILLFDLLALYYKNWSNILWNVVFAQHRHYRMHFFFCNSNTGCTSLLLHALLLLLMWLMLLSSSKINKFSIRMTRDDEETTLIECKWMYNLKTVSQMNRMLNSMQMSKFVHLAFVCVCVCALLNSIKQICWYRRAAKHNVLIVNSEKFHIAYKHWNQNVGQSSWNAKEIKIQINRCVDARDIWVAIYDFVEHCPSLWLRQLIFHFISFRENKKKEKN